MVKLFARPFEGIAGERITNQSPLYRALEIQSSLLGDQSTGQRTDQQTDQRADRRTGKRPDRPPATRPSKHNLISEFFNYFSHSFGRKFFAVLRGNLIKIGYHLTCSGALSANRSLFDVLVCRCRELEKRNKVNSIFWSLSVTSPPGST